MYQSRPEVTEASLAKIMFVFMTGQGKDGWGRYCFGCK